MIGIEHYLVVSSILFVLGVLGIFLNRKNIIVILMAIELILLAVNINLVAFSAFLGDLTGQVFAMFVLTVAAAEAAIGLAILVIYFRSRGTIAVDAAHGATASTTPAVLAALGARIVGRGLEPDGVRINDACGSEHPDGLAELVRAHGARLGIAHDGDGDRVVLVDETGAIVDGDELLALLALAAHREGRQRRVQALRAQRGRRLPDGSAR